MFTQECQFVDGLCYADNYDRTDANGQYQARCPDSWDYYVPGTFRYDGGAFSMYSHPTGGGTYEDLGICMAEIGDTELPSEPSAVYEHMLMVVDSSTSHFPGFSVGGVNIIITDPGCQGMFNTNCGDISFYQASTGWNSIGFGSGVSNSIYIMKSGPNRSIFNAYGWFTEAHEYGHALHARALSGIQQFGTCSSHSEWVASNLGCAWAEGFADYHAAVIVPSKGGFYTSSIVGPHAFVANGPTVEGEVAKTMYNLARGSSNLGDTYIARMIRDCRLSGNKISGVDFLVYCAEESVSTDAASHFTAYRNPSGLTVTWPAPPASWNLAAIRTVWHQYLFNE